MMTSIQPLDEKPFVVSLHHAHPGTVLPIFGASLTIVDIIFSALAICNMGCISLPELPSVIIGLFVRVVKFSTSHAAADPNFIVFRRISIRHVCINVMDSLGRRSFPCDY